jgi:peroxiredoxin
MPRARAAWSRWRRSRAGRWLIDLGLIAAVLLGVHAYQTRDAARGAAPTFAGVSLEGTPIALTELRGEPLVVHFWATWCGTCTAMRGNVAAIARDHRVLGVASQSGGVDRVRRFTRAHGIAWPNVVDERGALFRAYGVRAFPTSFFLDERGRVRHVEVGYTTELGMRLRLWL